MYIFVERGLFWIAFSTVFLHGAMELTAIVIAGGAGLIMGNSLLFPGTYSRWDSVKMGANDGLKIIVGLTPFILFAAFIESFLTRWYLELSSAGRLLIIISTFAAIIWYFFIYPVKYSKREYTAYFDY